MFHHSDPTPPPPPDPSRGHEMSDVAARPIVYFIIALVVFGGVLQAAMSTIMTGYVKQDTSVATPKNAIENLRDVYDLAPNRPAPLQRDTTGDMVKMYEEEDKFLLTYGVDPKTKAIRVPIERAIEIVAKKGLPHRDGPAPKSSYPVPQGKAYQATP